MRHETIEILTALQSARAEGIPAALATVVRVQGSAYRREGARMLIRQDGALTCMVSGGCLEPDVAEVARRVLRTGTPELRHYDLDEDVVWGLGLGCGGTVDILIEPVTDDPVLSRWLKALSGGELAVLATALPGATPSGSTLPGASGRKLMLSSGESSGALPSRAIDEDVSRAAGRLLDDTYPQPITMRYEADPTPVDVFLDVSVPPSELVIFGAGHDAIPLAALAIDLGWSATIVDSRTAFTSADRFPGARLILSAPPDFASQVTLGPRSCVVVMNHHLERDGLALAFALHSSAGWIGLLGPRSRFGKLLDRWRADGITPTDAQLARVHNPIGVDIGAESPREVALSIMAGLIAQRRGFQGRMLDGTSGRIHDPQRQG